MGKVTVPQENTFVRKVFLALLILVGLITISLIALLMIGEGMHEAINMAIGIVTHVDIVNQDISLKYFFVVMGVLGNVVQFYLIYVILEYLLEGKFSHIFSGVKLMKKVSKMKDHFIIAGGGRVGQHAAENIQKYTDNLVIIDAEEETVQKLNKKGFIAVKGDMLDEQFLEEINIEEAKHLICCLGDDSDNLLLVLTAKEMNPGLKISARANMESTIPKLKHAGANYVICPSSLGGIELAKSAIRSD